MTWPNSALVLSAGSLLAELGARRGVAQVAVRMKAAQKTRAIEARVMANHRVGRRLPACGNDIGHALLGDRQEAAWARDCARRYFARALAIPLTGTPLQGCQCV